MAKLSIKGSIPQEFGDHPNQSSFGQKVKNTEGVLNVIWSPMDKYVVLKPLQNCGSLYFANIQLLKTQLTLFTRYLKHGYSKYVGQHFLA